MRSRPLVLTLLAGLALGAAGCGSSAHHGRRPAAQIHSGPFMATLADVRTELARRHVRVVRQTSTPEARLSLPHPQRAVSLRTADGTVLDVLLYGSPQVALRAGASFPSDLLALNVVGVLHRRGDDAPRVANAFAALEARSSPY